MEKTKLAICMKDLEYQDRFVNCFINHYKHQYELHVFTNLDELQKSIPLEFAVIITGEYSTEEMASFVERGEILLHLVEDDSGDNRNTTEKYQEVYKIAERAGHLVACSENGNILNKTNVNYKKTAIYSLTREYYQTPFAAFIAKMYSEDQKVLVLDLQGYSGFQDLEDVTSKMGLEDLLSIAMTEKYSKRRMLESVRHEPEYDYVSPVHNTQCLAEGSAVLFLRIMDALAREFGYERFIINFGTVFSGQMEMMEQCEELYLLEGEEKDGEWREKNFCKELNALGKSNLFNSVKRISIPHSKIVETEWRDLVERWSWGSLGKTVRHLMEKECTNGTIMRNDSPRSSGTYGF